MIFSDTHCFRTSKSCHQRIGHLSVSSLIERYNHVEAWFDGYWLKSVVFTCQFLFVASNLESSCFCCNGVYIDEFGCKVYCRYTYPTWILWRIWCFQRWSITERDVAMGLSCCRSKARRPSGNPGKSTTISLLQMHLFTYTYTYAIYIHIWYWYCKKYRHQSFIGVVFHGYLQL